MMNNQTELILTDLDKELLEFSQKTSVPDLVRAEMHAILKLWKMDIYVFVQQEMVKYFEEKINEYEQKIQYYEKKYGMDLDTFRKNVLQLQQFETFEKENDDMDWEFYSKLKSLAHQKLSVLYGRT